MLTAKYTCHDCNMTIAFDVRERAKDEGLENYIWHVRRMAGEVHERMNPRCQLGRAEKVLDIMVPMTKAGIGYPGEELSDEDKRALNEQIKAPPEKRDQ